MKATALFSGVAVLLALAGCGTSEPARASQSGGATSSGGHSGGSSGSGGAAGSGGANSSGGTTQSGGSKGSGGTTATGGKGSGGTTTTGGKGSGGTTASGGTTSTGGSATSGGAIGSGGRQETGGTAAGGVTGSGGIAASGGATAIAGHTGAIDASMDRPPMSRDATIDAVPACVPEAQVCTEADKTVTSGIGKHCCYTYENWVGAGSASMTLKTDGFSVNWSNARFVGRKGIRPGSGDLVVTYNANFQPNGNGYLAVYGWTTDPLVEYYVLESWGSYKPPGGSSLGTITSDGATYDIYKSMRNNEDSIIGKATFPQYWSIRQQKRTSGTITMSNHIKGWAGKSMPMGTFYEVSMTVEGYQSSGTADVKFSIK